MKNVDLSTGWKADELHEDNYSPKQLSMRKHLTKKSGRTGRYEYMWPDGAYGKQGRILRYIPRLLEKSIGKSFDEVFSKFCKEYPEYIGELNTREEFKNHFEEYKPGYSWWRPYGSFHIDEQGRITPKYNTKRRRKHRNKVEFYTEEPKHYYTLNRALLKKYPALDNVIYLILGAELYNYLFYEDRLNERLIEKVQSLLRYCTNSQKILNALGNDAGNYIWGEEVVRDLFKKESDTPTYEFKKGSDEYIQYHKEASDKKKKIQREREEERKEQYEAMLHKIWELEQQEKKQNIIDRDRLGFDDKSFKKEKEE